MAAHTEWELAGLTRIGSGSLDLPFPDYGWVRLRNVALDDDRLIYGHDPYNNPHESVILQRRGTGLLDGFVRLADAPPDKILAYARKWGTLGICEHGLPSTHLLSKDYVTFQHPGVDYKKVEWPDSLPDDGTCREMHAVEPVSLVRWEPLSAWRNYAQRARALLNLIAAVEGGLPPRTEDILIAYPTITFDERDPSRVGIAQSAVGRCISDWLAISGIRLDLVWSEQSKPALMLREGGLFGAIGMSLAMQAIRSDGLAICSGCGRGYAPSRAPRRGQRNYCPECRADGIPQRDATRALRARRANKAE